MNEPAFPLEMVYTQENEKFNGMTLRDYFAAKAMQPFLDTLVKQGWRSDDLQTVAETFTAGKCRSTNFMINNHINLQTFL